MKTNRQIEKIKAVALLILNETGKELDFLSLYKKMYFSQKLYLARYGRPIFEDSFRARPLGPVPSFTELALNCALGGRATVSDDVCEFDKSFVVQQRGKVKYVRAGEEPDLKKISELEHRVISEIVETTRHMTPEQLSELSHDQAWKSAFHNPKDNYIRLASMAETEGASEDMVAYIRNSQAFETFISH